jgi:hypothetical protein
MKIPTPEHDHIALELQRSWATAQADSTVVLRCETEQNCYSFQLSSEQADRFVSELSSVLDLRLIKAEDELVAEPEGGGRSIAILHRHLAQQGPSVMREGEFARWSVVAQTFDVLENVDEHGRVRVELNGFVFLLPRVLAKELTHQLAGSLGHWLPDPEREYLGTVDAQGRIVLKTEGKALQ